MDAYERHRKKYHETHRRHRRRHSNDERSYSCRRRHRSEDARRHGSEESLSESIRPCSARGVREEELFQLFDKCRGMLERIRHDKSTHSKSRSAVNHANLRQLPMDPSTISQASHTYQVKPRWETVQQIDRTLSSDGDTTLHKLEVSLLCPLTQARIVMPVRGHSCLHLQCFDAEAFQRLMAGKLMSRRLCPCCNTLTNGLIVDVFTQELLQAAPKDAKIIEFTSSTQWKVKQDYMDTSRAAPCKAAVVDLTDIPDTPIKLRSSVHDQSVIDLTLSP